MCVWVCECVRRCISFCYCFFSHGFRRPSYQQAHGYHVTAANVLRLLCVYFVLVDEGGDGGVISSLTKGSRKAKNEKNTKRRSATTRHIGCYYYYYFLFLQLRLLSCFVGLRPVHFVEPWKASSFPAP
jgi:hypothetical protein